MQTILWLEYCVACTVSIGQNYAAADCLHNIGREPLPGYDPVAQRQEAANGRRTSSGGLTGELLAFLLAEMFSKCSSAIYPDAVDLLQHIAGKGLKDMHTADI